MLLTASRTERAFPASVANGQNRPVCTVGAETPGIVGLL